MDRATTTLTTDIPAISSLALMAATPQGVQMHALPYGVWVDAGRAPEAFIFIDDDGVSRSHVRIRVGEEVRVEDLGSKNGTSLDGTRLAPNEPVVWHRGSTLAIGKSLLILQGAPAQPAPPTHSSICTDDRWDAMLERIASYDAAVLILGETGVGKEITAERLHKASARASGPLIKVHATAIVPTLFESELFGHERGSFTGATRGRAGLIEQAHGGTLFVDEVGELPAEAQVKLLRVLEDKRIRRVGSDHDRPIDFRLLAATHRSLEDEVREGRFRRDLYFRIATFAVRVPSLRERKHEIPRLTSDLLANWAASSGKRAPMPDPECEHMLLGYDWPGNVRELRAVLEHAAVVGDGRVMRAADLPLLDMRRRLALDSAQPESGPPSTGPVPPITGSVPPITGSSAALSMPPPGQSGEAEAVLDALRKSGGNQKRAAEILGISRRTLLYRLDRLNLPRPRKSPTIP